MKIPSRAERVAAFRAIFPLLPLFEPMPVLYAKSKASTVPTVLSRVAIAGNVDFDASIAKELGIRDETFVDDQQELVDGMPPENELDLEETVGMKLPPERLLSPLDYAKSLGSRPDETALVWILGLPILDPTKTKARFTAQLQSAFGGADWIAWAKRTGTKWTLERWTADE